MTIYQSLGLTPIINAHGTITGLGGSRMDPATVAAMAEASESFIDVFALQRVAGRRIAHLLGVTAACITAGAAAGLAVAAAACMAHDDADRVLRLPDTEGMPDEVLILRSHRFIYDRAVLLSGARLVEIETSPAMSAAQLTAQLEGAITDSTAMFLYAAQAEMVGGSLAIPDVAAVLRRRRVPLLVDAAAEFPPRENLGRYLRAGADLVVVSGGKEIRGPQSSGLILGDEYLVGCCIANCSPNISIGRAMKTDKETIVGLLAAVESYCSRDYRAVYAAWDRMVDQVISALSGLADVMVRRGYPTYPDIQPQTIPRAYVRSRRISAVGIRDALIRGEPPIAVGIDSDEVVLNPQCLTEEDIPPLTEGLLRVLREPPRPDAPKAWPLDGFASA